MPMPMSNRAAPTAPYPASAPICEKPSSAAAVEANPADTATRAPNLAAMTLPIPAPTITPPISGRSLIPVAWASLPRTIWM